MLSKESSLITVTMLKLLPSWWKWNLNSIYFNTQQGKKEDNIWGNIVYLGTIYYFVTKPLKSETTPEYYAYITWENF